MWMFKEQTEMGQYDLQQDQLLTSLTTFIELYSCREDYFKMTADNFAWLSQESIKDNSTRALLGGFCGASLGGTIGALGGCVAGSLGAVGAVCAATACTDGLKPLNATAGFFGSVMGGVVGATFAGVLGGAIGAAGESAGHSVYNEAYKVAWFAIGGATGAGIGHIFGGQVGLAGGAVGGAIGGFVGVSATVSLLKAVLGQAKDICQAQNSQKQTNEVKEDSVIYIFKQNTSLLLAELLEINKISSEMDRKSEARSVAVQSSKCLTAVADAERALGHVRYTPQTTSCLGKAAERCKQVSEELEKMKCEAEKLLALWSKLSNEVVLNELTN